MISTLEFEHGEQSCAVEHGKFCRFFATENFGQRGVCALFDAQLHRKNGWIERCMKCKQEFK